MKNIIFAVLLFTIRSVSYGQANYLVVQDTRIVNDAPTAFLYKVSADFKESAIIAAPGAGYYTTLLTIAPWNDNSGGKMHQLGFNDGGDFS